MKVYELMNLLSTSPAGAEVLIYTERDKKDFDETLEKKLVIDLKVTGIMDENENAVLLEVE